MPSIRLEAYGTLLSGSLSPPSSTQVLERGINSQLHIIVPGSVDATETKCIQYFQLLENATIPLSSARPGVFRMVKRARL